MKVWKLRSLRVAVVVLLLLTVGGVSFAGNPAEEPRVPITMDSRPEFAEVYLDGKFIGSAGITPRLAPGQYTIEMRHHAYESWSRKLTVLPGGQSRVVALLERRTK